MLDRPITYLRTLVSALGHQDRDAIIRSRARVDSSARLCIDPSARIASGRIWLGAGAELKIDAGVTISADISVGDRSRLHICRGANLSGVSIELRDRAEASIGEGCQFDARNGARSHIGLFGSNAVFGANVQVHANVKITAESGSDLCFGDSSVISNVSFDLSKGAIADMGRGCIFDSPENMPNNVAVQAGKMVLPEYVRVQSDILVRFGGELTIGKYSGIGYRSLIRCEERVSIGEYCMISYDVAIFDTNTHSTDWRERREIARNSFPIGAPETVKPDTSPIQIGDDVWIGMGASILKGVKLGDRCIVGMRAMVTRGDYAAGSAIVAQPPRVIPPRE
jgi:acetyltransferase-like isoleucine patch superfamily enzyme